MRRSQASARRLRRGAGLLAALASITLLGACGDSGSSGDQDAGGPVGRGITTPVKLQPFEPSGEAGTVPDLPKRVALAMDNDREFAQSIKRGLEAAAEDRDLEFVSANADGDSAKNVQQMQQFLAQGVGALFVNPIDPAAQAPVMRDAIEKGAAVFGVLMPPATTQLNADQHAVGKALGDDAARYIEEELGGEAQVVILNQDSVQPVRPRFEAIREVLRGVPGAEVVADIEPSQTQKDSAFQTMSTILQKNPDVDVVLGADSVVLGAYAALQAAQKDRPDMYLGGIDGEPEALAAILRGGPYKATVALAPAMFAYASGQAAADWLEGKSIPQAIDIPPVLLNSPDTVEQFQADEQDPAAAWADEATRAKYVRPLGDISYETRGDYLAYGWAP